MPAPEPKLTVPMKVTRPASSVPVAPVSLAFPVMSERPTVSNSEKPPLASTGKPEKK